MKNQIQRIYRHIFKNGTLLFAIAGAIATLTAWFIGEHTISTYNLSPLFLIPNTGKAIHGIFLVVAFLGSVIFSPLWAYYVAKNKLFSIQKNTFWLKLVSLILNMFFGCMGLLEGFILLLFSNIQPFWKFNADTVWLIARILIVISAFSYLVWLSICYFNKEENPQANILSFNKAPVKEKVKRISLTIYAISYIALSIIPVTNTIKITFLPYSKSNEYEYITTKEHGDCVVLIRNDTQYVMEAFDYDEATGHLTVYAGEYYVQDLSDVTIRKITFESEDIVNTIKPQDDKKE